MFAFILIVLGFVLFLFSKKDFSPIFKSWSPSYLIIFLLFWLIIGFLTETGYNENVGCFIGFENDAEYIKRIVFFALSFSLLSIT